MKLYVFLELIFEGCLKYYNEYESYRLLSWNDVRK